MHDTYLSDKNDERINPAVEGLQRELLQEFAKSGRKATSDVKYQALTIGTADTAHPLEVDHGCTSVKFWTVASDMYVGDTDSQPVLLVASIWNELHINNTSLLRFKSTTVGTIVYVVSSN